MKVATYTRISTDEERQPFSLEAQGDRLSAYIASQDGWHLVRSFTDQQIRRPRARCSVAGCSPPAARPPRPRRRRRPSAAADTPPHGRTGTAAPRRPPTPPCGHPEECAGGGHHVGDGASGPSQPERAGDRGVLQPHRGPGRHPPAPGQPQPRRWPPPPASGVSAAIRRAPVAPAG
jgi:hypothetical protein